MLFPHLSFLSAQHRSVCCLMNEYDDDSDDDLVIVVVAIGQSNIIIKTVSLQRKILLISNPSESIDCYDG